MAIAILQQPTQFAPAYNPMIVTFGTTNLSLPNFRYIVQIIIGSQTKKIKLSPRPDGVGVIDIHRIIENYLTYDFAINGAQAAIQNTASAISYTVRIGEEYGANPVEYLNLANFTQVAINAALRHSVGSGGGAPDFITYDYTEYNIVTAATKKFLTASPRIIDIGLTQNYYLHYATTSTFSTSYKAQFKYYDLAGSLLGTRNIDLNANKYNRIGCGTQNILNTNPSDLTGCKYYTVQLIDNSSNPMSELFRFNIEPQCSKTNEKFRLQWLNPLGGFDAYNFNYTFKRSFDIEKKKFNKQLGVMDTGIYIYTPQQQGNVQFNTVANETIYISSGWVTEEESEWLSQLFMSPQIFWEKTPAIAIPVTLTDAKYQQRTYAVDNKLFIVEATMEIANEIMRQRQ